MILRILFLVSFLFLGHFPMDFLAQAQETKSNFSSEILSIDKSRPEYQLVLDAKLVPKGETIERGMFWRVFSETTNQEGKLPLVATAKGGTATFNLNAGTYLVHAAFGRAGASKRVIVSEGGAQESFILKAGGLELHAVTKDISIPAKDLRFSIYELKQDEDGKRKLIAFNVAANKVIQLNEGIYHVLSRYGTINATVRADLEVKAGEVTKATLQHRGAAVSLRLVSESGGDPVANTAWTVFTKDGEKVFGSRNFSPSFILAEGSYEAVVRNGASNFTKNFTVSPGKNIRVEILLK
ncbi:MAG: hypothetical protein V3V04_02620 [Rhizobiaceae bacterium]